VAEASTFEVLATARAAEERVGPLVDGVLRVRVTRPAAEGQANEAIRRLAARALDVAPSRLSLVAGARSRHKRFSVDGLTSEELATRLARLG
jgi:hypothetical protein